MENTIQPVGCVKNFALQSPGALLANGYNMQYELYIFRKYEEDSLSYLRNSNPNSVEEESLELSSRRANVNKKLPLNPSQSMPNINLSKSERKMYKYNISKFNRQGTNIISPYSAIWNKKVLESFFDIRCTEPQKRKKPAIKIRKIPKLNPEKIGNFEQMTSNQLHRHAEQAASISRVYII